MSLSDFLAVLEILITVLVGFVISHLVSVRDSRMRAIKDYYIEDLYDIKQKINEFYSSIFKGESDAQQIIGWYSAIRNRVYVYEKAITKAFGLHLPSLSKRLFINYRHITDAEEFNADYSKTKIVFSGNTKSKIGREEKYLYDLLDRIIYDINNSAGLDLLSRKWLELKHHYGYYSLSKKSKISSCFHVAWDWLLAHKSKIIGLAFGGLVIYLLITNIEKVISKDQDEETTSELVQSLDNLNAILEQGFYLSPVDTVSVKLIQQNAVTQKGAPK